MKKIIIMIGSFLVSISLISFPTSESEAQIKGFSDVQGHWAEKGIYQMVDLNIVNGFPNGTFKPENQVIRAEFIKMLIEALQVQKDEKRDEEKWYELYVRAAIDLGIHRESDFNKLWDQKLTRIEMVRLAVRAVDEATRPANAIVKDESFMLKATQLGIIHGLGDGELAPEGLSTRAQAVTVIGRILALRAGQILQIDEQAISMADMDLRVSNVPLLSEDEIWDPESPRHIKLEVAKYYEMKVHESFEVVDGHLQGYLPLLPKGFYYSLAFNVYYDPKDKVTATNHWPLNYGYELKQGEPFSIPIKHERKVKKMILVVGIADLTTQAERRFSSMDYINNKEITEYTKY